MKVLLLDFNIDATVGLHQGLMSLSASLKKNHHEVRLLLLNDKIGTCFNLEKIEHIVTEYGPDIIGISIVETQLNYIKKFCNYFSHYYIICGGPYVTINPYTTLRIKGVNSVCIGEGEEAFCELCNGKKRPLNILSDNHHKISLRPFNSLKNIPPPDYNLFDLDSLLPIKNNQLEVMIGRGCTGKCSYCINDSYLKKYKGFCTIPPKPKDYIRYRNADEIIEELVSLKCSHNIEEIAFIDDNITGYPAKFLDNFFTSYKKKVTLPFTCNASPLSINVARTTILKNANCTTIRIGLESGSDRIKKEILNRPISNKKIITASKVINDLDINLSTYNMIGLPLESKEDIIETLKLNAYIKPKYVKLMIFYPFECTPIYKKCEDLGLIDHEIKKGLTNYNSNTCINFSPEHRKFIMDVQSNFDRYISKFSNKNYSKITDSVAIRN